MPHAIGRATAPDGSVYTPDFLSDATLELFRSLTATTTTYPLIPRQRTGSATTATAPVVAPVMDCPSWCTGVHAPDGDGDVLHESVPVPVDGIRDDVFIGRWFTATVQVESFVSGDGSVNEPPAVALAIAPAQKPEVDEDAAAGMPDDLVRHLAAWVLSGAACGESVVLPPSVAVALGTALVNAGLSAGGAQ
jgi:hypothetical protein